MSIAELRAVCQPAYKKKIDPLMEWHLLRPISIYLTWLFTRLGLRANHVSCLGFCCALAGAICMMMGEPAWGLAGAILVWSSFLFDCVDGEVSRYWGQSSLRGTYLDYLVGGINDGLILLGLGFYVSAVSGWDARIVVSLSVMLVLTEKLIRLYVHSLAFRNCPTMWDEVEIQDDENYAEKVWFEMTIWQRLIRVPFETFFRVSLVLVAMSLSFAFSNAAIIIGAWGLILSLGTVLSCKAYFSEFFRNRVEETTVQFIQALKSKSAREPIDETIEDVMPTRRAG